MSTKPDIRDREQVRSYLDSQIARPNPTFSTYDPEWLRGYQRKVRRWLDCAPAGAVYLIAPFTGWNGEPIDFKTGANSRDVPGPSGLCSKAVREARMRHGRHPITGLAA